MSTTTDQGGDIRGRNNDPHHILTQRNRVDHNYLFVDAEFLLRFTRLFIFTLSNGDFLYIRTSYVANLDHAMKVLLAIVIYVHKI